MHVSEETNTPVIIQKKTIMDVLGWRPRHRQGYLLVGNADL